MADSILVSNHDELNSFLKPNQLCGPLSTLRFRSLVTSASIKVYFVPSSVVTIQPSIGVSAPWSMVFLNSTFVLGSSKAVAVGDDDVFKTKVSLVPKALKLK